MSRFSTSRLVACGGETADRRLAPPAPPWHAPPCEGARRGDLLGVRLGVGLGVGLGMGLGVGLELRVRLA